MPGTISVLVPTFRRPENLRRCLVALTRQRRKADEVIVVLRNEDSLSATVLAEHMTKSPYLRDVVVHSPGQVAALNAGLASSTGDIVAITDDDTEVAPDWLERIERHLESDPAVGGVGGRDDIYHDGERAGGTAGIVGIVQWWGRYIGNHHLGHGRAREVDILKGANMSFRREAIGDLRFDTRLRGSGAQVANDLQFALSIRKKGWKLIYDPEVLVRHHLADRHDDDHRKVRSPTAQSNAAHNQAVALLDYLSPWQRPIFVVWALLIGTREIPGLAQAIRIRFILPPDERPSLRATLAGRLAGLRTWMSPR